MPFDRSWLPISENHQSSPPKNNPCSQEMHLKILRFSWGLKLSNSKPGCEVSALHFFVNQMPPMAFWQSSFWLVLLHVLIPRLTSASLLESKRGFEIVTELAVSENDHLHICSPWCDHLRRWRRGKTLTFRFSGFRLWTNFVKNWTPFKARHIRCT